MPYKHSYQQNINKGLQSLYKPKLAPCAFFVQMKKGLQGKTICNPLIIKWEH
jgi:hypothetical protein